MPYEYTEQGKALLHDVVSFMDDHIYPNEAEYHEQLEALGHDGDPPILDKLKAAARERGLWNMFLPAPLARRAPARSSPTSTTRRSPSSSARSASPPRR